jgi:hypothetical protein
MLFINETTLTGDVRAEVSFARDHGKPVDKDVAFWLATADMLEVPDDAMFVPAVLAAMATPTQLDDPESLAYTKAIARRRDTEN